MDDTETPVSAFLKVRQSVGCFLLESAEQGRSSGRYSFLGVASRERIRLCGDRVVVSREGADHEYDLADHAGDPFAFLADYMRRRRVAKLDGLPPFVGGGVGYFGYDLVRRVESLGEGPPDDLGLPEMAFLIPDVIMVFDHLHHEISLVTNVATSDRVGLDAAYQAAAEKFRLLKDRLCRPVPAVHGGRPAGPGHPTAGPVASPGDHSTHVSSNFLRADFLQAVERAKEYIYAGDIFQVVLSQRFELPVEVSAFSIYRGLRAVNPSSYMYFLSFPDFEVVGSSPEPLVSAIGSSVKTRPIAGTRPRGATPEEDLVRAEELLADEKERAEHVMLVDLGRNDLGRVCRPGSVRLAEFMNVERYSHVMHLASTVVGELDEGRTAVDALRSAFPAGTVSGAPKIRAMQIIDELEPTRRGPYAGAIGYFGYGGELDTCIYIRTMVVRDGRAYVQAGAGIVADSVPELEYEETQNKARALFRAIELATEQKGWE
jgi:anthranilate synthase component 1